MVNGPWDLGGPANAPGWFGQTFTQKCNDFDMQFVCNVEVKLLPHTEFQKLVSLDSSWEKQTIYGWANMTVLLPDANSQEWTELRLTQEVEEKRCGKTNSKKKTAPPNE